MKESHQEDLQALANALSFQRVKKKAQISVNYLTSIAEETRIEITENEKLEVYGSQGVKHIVYRREKNKKNTNVIAEFREKMESMTCG